VIRTHQNQFFRFQSINQSIIIQETEDKLLNICDGIMMTILFFDKPKLYLLEFDVCLIKPNASEMQV